VFGRPNRGPAFIADVPGDCVPDSNFAALKAGRLKLLPEVLGRWVRIIRRDVSGFHRFCSWGLEQKQKLRIVITVIRIKLRNRGSITVILSYFFSTTVRKLMPMVLALPLESFQP
tara:strand:+ start:370 stop:714 length:345 start_codon:yes stop_codon:yes gene_type:complete